MPPKGWSKKKISEPKGEETALQPGVSEVKPKEQAPKVDPIKREVPGKFRKFQ